MTPSRLRVYALESVSECLKQYRMPAPVVFGFGFPLMFYVGFGLLFREQSDPASSGYARHALATLAAFGVISSALYGIGVGIATERGQGWMLLKRASPMPPEGYLVAKLVLSVISASIIVLLLSGAGVFVLGVRMPAGSWLALGGVLVLGVLPFCGLGLAIGYWTGPNSAVAVVNLLNMPMAILSGLWMPLDMLPQFARTVARYLPPYHYSQLALQAIGQGEQGSALGHVLALTIFLVACVALASVGYRRNEDKTYG